VDTDRNFVSVESALSTKENHDDSDCSLFALDISDSGGDIPLQLKTIKFPIVEIGMNSELVSEPIFDDSEGCKNDRFIICKFLMRAVFLV